MANYQPDTILSSKTCDVQYCEDCKMLHINMGSITLRMNEEHFAAFAIDMSKAMFHMRQREIHQADMRVMM
jgi:hypothetical protein